MGASYNRHPHDNHRSYARDEQTIRGCREALQHMFPTDPKPRKWNEGKEEPDTGHELGQTNNDEMLAENRQSRQGGNRPRKTDHRIGTGEDWKRTTQSSDTNYGSQEGQNDSAANDISSSNQSSLATWGPGLNDTDPHN